MASKYWFKPKTYGYGVTPTTWEGWSLVLGGVAAIMASSWYFLGLGAPLSIFEWLAWAIVIAATVLILATVSYYKTDGAWRWRWGSSSESR